MAGLVSKRNGANDLTCADANQSTELGSQAEGGVRRRSVLVMEIHIECFSGDGATNVDVYLAQFRVAARRNGWRQAEWGDELALRLQGEARNLILPEVNSEPPMFEEVARKLRQRFGAAEAPDIHESELRARWLRDKETIPQLLQ